MVANGLACPSLPADVDEEADEEADEEREAVRGAVRMMPVSKGMGAVKLRCTPCSARWIVKLYVRKHACMHACM